MEFGAWLIGGLVFLAMFIANAVAQRRSMANGDPLLLTLGKGSLAALLVLAAIGAVFVALGVLVRAFD